MLKECLKMSWLNVKNDRMRSFLTMLGVIIGVASVIALISIIQGITGEVMGQFDSLGSNSLTVSAPGSVLKSGLTTDDLEELKNVNHVTGISVSVQGSSAAVRGKTVIDTVIVKGKNETYFENNDEIMLSGRTLTKLDDSANTYVCIVDENMAEEAFANGNPVGETLTIGGHTYTVIGVMKNDDSLVSMFSGSDSDPSVIIPYKNAMKLLGISSLTSAEIYYDNVSNSDEVKTALENKLDEIFNYKDDTYTVTSMDSLIEAMEEMQTMLTAMLAGIASISLVVGGIGIMNMMLVSVSERTKEIGLRKALGAEPWQIQLQFCIESIFLSSMGGLIGIILGVLISEIAGLAMGVVFMPSAGAILLGVGFSLGVGVIFGWAPAKKASKLNPIDALRSE